MKQTQIKIIGDGKETEGIMAYNWNLFINGEKIKNVKRVNLEIIANDITTLDITIGGGNVEVEGFAHVGIRSEKEKPSTLFCGRCKLSIADHIGVTFCGTPFHQGCFEESRDEIVNAMVKELTG